MDETTTKTAVHEAPERGRYEILVDGELAGFAVYRDVGDTRVFTHTEVSERFEGRGLGSALIRWALDDVRARGGSIVALCPFVDDYVDDHAGYGDLVDAELDLQLRRR